MIMNIFLGIGSNIGDRRKNIQEAFLVNALHLGKENIILIDDILTSGSTICESGKTIKQKYPDIELIGLTIASGDKYM